MRRYRRIIAGVNGSPASRHALKEAIRLAQWGKGGVTAVAVTPSYEGDLSLVGVRHPQRLTEGPCGDILQEARNTAHGCEIRIEETDAIGEPYREIENLAREDGSDLIVLGIQGHSSLLRSLTGSTIRQAILSGACDTLCVPEGVPLHWERILCLLDSAADPWPLAHRAIELAAAYGGKIRMVARPAVLTSVAFGGSSRGTTAAISLMEEINVLADKAEVACEVLTLDDRDGRGIFDRILFGEAISMLLIGKAQKEQRRGWYFHKAFWASHAVEKMIRLAPCPTLIIRI